LAPASVLDTENSSVSRMRRPPRGDLASRLLSEGFGALQRRAGAGRVQLRALGIETTFSREGRAGSRAIRLRATRENTARTVSSVCDQPRPVDLVGRRPIEQASVTAADDADGADANVGVRFG